MSDHQIDESKPTTFIKFVGPVYTCTCGRDVVAGHPCPGEGAGQ